MRKFKITKEQYDRLSLMLNESKMVKGGINRVDNSFKKELSKVDVQNLDEDNFDIKAATPNLPNSLMKKKKEPLDENVMSEQLQQALSKFIENIWMNPSQHGLDKIFVQNGVTWGDIASYLTTVGILSVVGAGLFKVNNFFKRRFSSDSTQAMHQKLDDIHQMAKVAVKDPKAPWNTNRLKDPNGQTTMKTDVEEVSPAFTTPPKMFKPVYKGVELAILSAPSGMYIYDFSEVDPRQFDSYDSDSYHDSITIESITDYVNENLSKISKGDGLSGFDGGADLILMDDELKVELMNLYQYDKDFVAALSKLDEMTSATSSGAFTAPLSTKIVTRELKPSADIVDEEAIDETTTAASSGSYVQPQIWAKNKANWKAGAATQYPNGEMVKFDSCTKLNNNKSAQGGGCSTGAINGVVKTKKTKHSVISPSLDESAILNIIAQKTGKKVEEIKEIITNKINNVKALA